MNINLLSVELFLFDVKPGMTNQEILQLEMATQLCLCDKTHSQLVDLVSFHIIFMTVESV